MNYRKYSSTLPGFYIRWGNTIFPDYRDVSGANVSEKRLRRAKKIVVLILQQEEKTIVKAFEEFCRKKYRGDGKVVRVDVKAAIERVKEARLQPENDERWGESDGFRIWISRDRMSSEQLVGTLLHESLHFIATLDNKEICSKDEHHVMKGLGERDDC